MSSSNVHNEVSFAGSVIFIIQAAVFACLWFVSGIFGFPLQAESFLARIFAFVLHGWLVLWFFLLCLVEIVVCRSAVRAFRHRCTALAAIGVGEGCFLGVFGLLWWHFGIVDGAFFVMVTTATLLAVEEALRVVAWRRENRWQRVDI